MIRPERRLSPFWFVTPEVKCLWKNLIGHFNKLYPYQRVSFFLDLWKIQKKLIYKKFWCGQTIWQMKALLFVGMNIYFIFFEKLFMKRYDCLKKLSLKSRNCPQFSHRQCFDPKNSLFNSSCEETSTNQV